MPYTLLNIVLKLYRSKWIEWVKEEYKGRTDPKNKGMEFNKTQNNNIKQATFSFFGLIYSPP